MLQGGTSTIKYCLFDEKNSISKRFEVSHAFCLFILSHIWKNKQKI